MKILKNEYFIIYGILVLFLVYNFFNFYNSISVGVINHEGIPSKIISFINSDMLTLPALFKNLVFEGGKYSDWYLSAAPYFFPDILLFFILSFIFSNFYIVMGIFAIIQHIILFFGIYFLSKEFTQNSLFVALMAFILLLFCSYDFIYILSFTQSYHFGEFAFGVWWLWLIIKIFKENNNLKYIIFAIILGSLLKASDNIFTLHFILPIICVCFVLKALDIIDFKKLFLFIFICLASYALGVLLYDVLMMHNTSYPMNFTSEAFKNNIIFLKKYWKENKIASLIILGICIYASLSLLFKNLRCKTHYLFYFLFCLVSLLATIMVSLSHFILPPTDRYFTTVFGLCIILFSIFTFSKFNKFFRILSCISILFLPNYSMFKAIDFTYKTPLSVCIDEFKRAHPVKHGVSEYWQAKVIYMLSNISMAQISGNLEDIYMVTSNSFFKDKYDFIIINNKPVYDWSIMDKQKIISINGTPDEIIECKEANSEILYYKNGLYTDEFLAKKVVHFDINTGLKNNIGKVFDNVIISNNKTGFLSFGPHKEIPAGKYKFDLIYSSSLNPDKISGFWDINLIVKKNHTIISKGDLAGTNSEFKTLSAQFETKEKAEIEIRSFYNGNGELKIKELVLYKID